MIRFKAVTNTVTPAGILTEFPLDNSDHLADILIRREFVAEDIGTDAGQTQDATDPTVGCFVGSFTGSRVKDIVILGLYQIAAANNRNFIRSRYGDANTSIELNFRIKFHKLTNTSDIYILDTASNAADQIVAGNWIYLLPILGETVGSDYYDVNGFYPAA